MTGAMKTEAAESLTERIDRLFRELELAIRWNRPSILLAVYASEFVRADVEAALTARLRELKQSVTPYVVVGEENADIPLQLARDPRKDRTVFFISGLQWGGGIDGRNAYRALNIRREYLVDYHIRAVFWLTKQEETMLPNHAPDFWAFRHRVVEFNDAPATMRSFPLAREMEWRDFKDRDLREDTDAKIAWRATLLHDLPEADETIVVRADLLYQLAALYWAKQDYEKSLAAIQQTLKITEPLEDAAKQAAYYNGMGNIYAAVGRTPEAVAAYQQAATLDPNGIVPLSNLGHLHRAFGQVNDAIAAFEQADVLIKKIVAPEKPKIFFSHAREDGELVRRLQAVLKPAETEVWVDHLGIRGGDNLPERISEVLNWCDTVLLIWSDAASKSPWVKFEWTHAIALNKFIIPCRLDATSLPAILRNRASIDFHNVAQGIAELHKALRLVQPLMPLTSDSAAEKKFPVTRGSVKDAPASPRPEIALRSKPLQDLTVGAAEKMLREKGFLDVERNKPGRGIRHEYEMIERGESRLVIDHSTGLIWQQSGSRELLNYHDAQTGREKLNRENWGGYRDWRLPTLEEAMSLVETKTHSELYLDPIFDPAQKWIWTADQYTAVAIWFVNFVSGYCDLGLSDLSYFVRAVR